MLIKSKLLIFSVFNLVLFMLIEFAHELNVDYILYPEGPNPFAPLIFEYWLYIVPKITLIIITYCIYKIFKKQSIKTQIVVLLINTILVSLYINYDMGDLFLKIYI